MSTYITEDDRTDYFKTTGTYGSDEEVAAWLKTFPYKHGDVIPKSEYIPRFNPSKEAAKQVDITRGDGGSTDYYELPKGATELKHLIKHKKMEHAIGEAFCALYRLNDNGEYLRNLKKVKYYIDSEIEWTERNTRAN